MPSNQASGFTLVELVIVVVLLGIIAGFAIPNYQRSVDKAHERDMTGQLTVLHAANSIYRAHEGNYWDTGGAAQNLAAINTNLGINIISNDGTVYSYTSPAGGATFDATATWGALPYTIRVTEVPIDTDGATPDNPCCATDNCASIIDCFP